MDQPNGALSRYGVLYPTHKNVKEFGFQFEIGNCLGNWERQNGLLTLLASCFWLPGHLIGLVEGKRLLQ